MTTLIRKTTLLNLDPTRGAEPFGGDLLFEGDRIAALAADLEIVVEKGRLTRVDEEGLLDELRDLLPPFQAEVDRKNRVFHPYFAEIHRRSTIQDIGINRYAGDLPPWPGANR